MYPRYNMYQNRNYMRGRDDRFIGGFIGPLLLGGIAGYAIGRPNYPYYPYNYYYNNFYYPYQYQYPIYYN